MNNEKIKQKYEGLLQTIIEGEQNEQAELELYAIQFKGLKSYLFTCKEAIPLSSSILITDLNKKVTITGNLSNYINLSEKNTNITIIVDNRKEGNTKIYINDQNEIRSISHKSNFQSKDKLHLFFQIGMTNCLVVAGFDETEEKTSIHEIFSQSSNVFSDFYTITKNLLLSLSGDNEVK